MKVPDDAEVVVIRRRIAASREAVFQEWTDPEGMSAWMCPGPVVSADVQLDARVGGALRIVMRTATDAFEHRGEFTVVDPPARLAFTWHARDTNFQATLVTIELYDAGNGHCDLVLTHERIPRTEITRQYRDGWNQIITRLQAYLS